MQEMQAMMQEIHAKNARDAADATTKQKDKSGVNSCVVCLRWMETQLDNQTRLKNVKKSTVQCGDKIHD